MNDNHTGPVRSALNWASGVKENWQFTANRVGAVGLVLASFVATTALVVDAVNKPESAKAVAPTTEAETIGDLALSVAIGSDGESDTGPSPTAAFGATATTKTERSQPTRRSATTTTSEAQPTTSQDQPTTTDAPATTATTEATTTIDEPDPTTTTILPTTTATNPPPTEAPTTIAPRPTAPEPTDPPTTPEPTEAPQPNASCRTTFDVRPEGDGEQMVEVAVGAIVLDGDLTAADGTYQWDHTNGAGFVDGGRINRSRTDWLNGTVTELPMHGGFMLDDGTIIDCGRVFFTADGIPNNGIPASDRR